MKAILVRDKQSADNYRVEFTDLDGGVEVAVFSGPKAYERAVRFAGSYYIDWIDETREAL